MMCRGVRNWPLVPAVAIARGGACPRWRTHSGGFQPSARAPWLLSCPHRHHSVLHVLKQGIAERLPRLLLQGDADLVVRDPAAVLRDQGDQVVDEVGEDGHRSEQWKGWG